MHTSQITHNRIYFSNVQNRDVLEDLVDALGMEATEDPNVYDLIQSEGESTVVCDALRDVYPERLFPVGINDSSDLSLVEIAMMLKSMADAEGIVPLSSIFDETMYRDEDNLDTDLDPDQCRDS